MFTFNISLNDVAPVDPILFSVFKQTNKQKKDNKNVKSKTSQEIPLIFSFVSVVFIFKESHRDSVPVSPISLPVEKNVNKVFGYTLQSLFLFTSQTETDEFCVYLQ